jgi:hypothetical protein
MDRKFYLQFLDACARDQESLETLQELIEKHLETPAEVMVRAKEGSDLPIITAKLEEGSGLVRSQGGMATIPAAFKSGDGKQQEIKLVPVFLHESAEIDNRFLDYEAVHIAALLDREGEYADYKEFFFKAPTPKSAYADKLAYLKHIARRILVHDRTAFFILHPGKNEKTVRSLILYQLGERLAWYMEQLEIDREQATADLGEMLEAFAAENDFYADCDISAYFRQTLVALSLFK